MRAKAIAIRLATACLGTWMPVAPAQDSDAAVGEGSALQQAYARMGEGRHEEAVRLLRAYLRERPAHPIALYNLACASSRLGRADDAVLALEDAARAGFLDFDQIRADADLAPLKDDPRFEAFLAREAEVRGSYMTNRQALVRAALGGVYQEYAFVDSGLRVLTDLPKERAAGVVAMINQVAAALGRSLFANRPTREVLAVVPASPADYTRRLGMSGGTAGRFDKDSSMLFINLATGGGTVSHEWTHVLHFADQEALGQRHAHWVVEGIGSLYEQAESRGGGLRGLVNWRLPILQAAVRKGTAFPLDRFLADSTRFFREDSSLAYAMSRYLMFYLQEQGRLTDFYRGYVASFDRDPTGVAALEAACGKPLAEIEADWLAFTRALGGKAKKPTPPAAAEP